MNKPNEAIAMCSRAISVDSESVDAYLSRGDAHLHLDHFQG